MDNHFWPQKSLLRDWLKQKTGAFMQKFETGSEKTDFLSEKLPAKRIPAAQVEGL